MRKYLAGTSAIAIIASCGQGLAAGQASPGQGAAPQLEQVIVTATHRKENLQKTAIAVTAVSAATLQAAGVVQARDLSKTVAGLSITASGPSSQVYLRGVGTFSVDAYTSSPVSTNLDGVYLSMPPMVNGVFYDVARVEVLKGPQGTLYGRNATAGAINIITNQPTRTMNGYASVEVGDYGLFNTTAAVNVPLTDKLDVRIAGQFLNRDGYYSDHSGRTATESARIQARYRPNETIELTLGADYQHATGQEEPLVVFGANPKNPWEGPTTAASNSNILAARNPADPFGVGLPPFFSSLLPTLASGDLGLRNDSAGVRADLEWTPGFANVSFISSYRHLATLFNTDPGFLSGETEMGRQFTEEFRVASPGDSGPWKWQAGLYYFYNSALQSKIIDEGFITSPESYTDTDKSAAAFGDLTYSILPHLRITGGLRGTTETISQAGSGKVIDTPAAFSALADALSASHVPSFLIPSIVDTTLRPISYNLSNSATFRNLSLKAEIEYDVAPNALAYASFTTGFKSGGIIADLNTPLVSNVFKPETLAAYAIGSKNRLFGGAVQANAEAFYWDYKNHQEIYLTQEQSDPLVSAPLTHNIGNSTVKGISLDMMYRPTVNDLLAGQLEYLDSTFNKFSYYEYTTPGYQPATGCQTAFLRVVQIGGQSQALNNVDCSGKPFTRAPHFSINLSLQHTFELGGDRGSLFALISSHITTSQWLAVDYTPLEHEGGLTVTDLNLTYEPPKGGWSVTGYVHNIENTASYSSAFAYAFASNVTLGGINPPRTFGGILKLRF